MATEAKGMDGAAKLGLGLGCGVGCLAIGVVAVPMIGIVAAIAIPNFMAMQLKAKRAEVPANVDGIRVAELAYQAAFDEFLPISSEAEARRLVSGKEQREFEGGAAWEKLGWWPDGKIRGAYWVEVNEFGIEVRGLCDVDGDGEFAEYRASDSNSALRVTDERVY